LSHTENPPADVIIQVLRAHLSEERSQLFAHAVLYTSFGVVRGRTGINFAREIAEPSPQVIELNEVTVEHYSNHLPTASFDRFYVRLEDVQGLAFIDPNTDAR
jgi:hypothetical protein